MKPDKSKSILFATSQRAQSLPDQISVNISGVSVPLCNYFKILGAVFDPRITLSQHTKAVTKSCFYHIRTVKQICSSLDDLTSELFPLLFLPDLITQILFCMVFHLSIILAFNAYKIPLHALLQVKATPNAVHPF